MNVGMLWFDNDAKANLESKIARAAGYYEKKYGLSPDLCFVHPSMLANGVMRTRAGKIEVRGNRSVLPNHFWIGIHIPALSQGAD
jgi:hypothetical protein